MSTVPAKSQRLPLLLLFALFAAPLAVAFWLYYGTGWRPGGSTNHGALITPVHELPTLAYSRPETRASVEQLFDGKWSLVVVADGQCDAQCRNTLVYARQTQLGLGRLGQRVQRVLLATGNCCDREYLEHEQGGLRIADLGELSALGAGRDTLLAAFPGVRRPQQVFVVDPLGNLMMSYDTDEDPKGLRQDLQKLLDLSHIG
jgi:hypothetical protein